MGDLLLRRVTKDVENIEFDCGTDSINEYVKYSYYSDLVKHAYAYSINYKETVLGYYQVLFRDVVLDDLPDDIGDMDPGIRNNISAAHLRFIAIDEKYQNNGIGTKVMKVVILQIKELAKAWPIRIITLDAVLGKISWYEKLGFRVMPHNPVEQEGTTQYMYIDCMSKSDSIKLQEYIEEYSA